MKRLLLTATGTVAGLAALLSFKTHTVPVAGASALPSDSSSSTGASTGTSSTGTSSTGTSSTAAPSTSASSATAAPTSYTGRAVTTRYGVVQVKATVSDGRITDVAFVQLTADDGRSQQIDSYAAPVLLKEAISAQTAQVDTVSGASYTSEGYRESLQSALDLAGLK